jgi:cell division protein FtsN
MKMTEFRSTHPLTDEDLAAIRANVMTKVSAQNNRRGIPLFVRLAIAALLVIAVGISFIVRQQTAPSIAASNPQVVRPPVAPQVNTTIATARAAMPSIPVQAAKSSIPRAPAKQPVARAIYRPKHRPPQNPEYQTIRMEIRTPDPDVRIIWIANQTPTTTGGNS